MDKGKYYSYAEKGGVFEWSNFTLRPLFHILDNIMPKRLYMIKNDLSHEELIELKQEDLVSLQKFKLKVEGLGNFIWKATEKELTKLKGYLYSQTETAQMITQLGWQRKGFFAFGNGIFFDGQWMKTDDFGIVHLGEKGNFYLPASSKIYRDETKMYDFERRFVHLNLSSVTLREFTDQFFLVFAHFLFNCIVQLCRIDQPSLIDAALAERNHLFLPDAFDFLSEHLNHKISEQLHITDVILSSFFTQVFFLQKQLLIQNIRRVLHFNQICHFCVTSRS